MKQNRSTNHGPLIASALLTAGALLLAGCGSSSTPPRSSTSVASSSSATPSRSATAQGTSRPPTAAPAGEPGAPKDYSLADMQSRESIEGRDQAIAAVRAAAHDGYTRVVIDFTGGDKTLQWFTSYSETATLEASGKVVPMPSKAILMVRLPALHEPSSSTETVLHGDQPATVLGSVLKTYVEAPFEGQATVFIALDSQHPYHVSTLTNPTRLVIDFQS